MAQDNQLSSVVIVVATALLLGETLVNAALGRSSHAQPLSLPSPVCLQSIHKLVRSWSDPTMLTGLTSILPLEPVVTAQLVCRTAPSRWRTSLHCRLVLCRPFVAIFTTQMATLVLI